MFVTDSFYVIVSEEGEAILVGDEDSVYFIVLYLFEELVQSLAIIVQTRGYVSEGLDIMGVVVCGVGLTCGDLTF